MHALPRISIAVAFMGLLSACGTTFIGTRAPDSVDAPQAALRYYLPKDVVDVVVTIKRTTATRVQSNNTLKLTKEVKEAPLGATVDLRTVADTSAAYLLDANARAFSKNNTALAIGETGLLQTVNAKSTGTGGTVFDNVLKIGGTALATTKYLVTQSAPPAKAAQAPEKGVHGFQTELGIKQLNAGILTTAACKNDDQIFQFIPNTPNYRFAFTKLTAKDELVSNFCDTLAYLAVRRAAYRKAAVALDNATAADAVKTLTAKVNQLHAEFDTAAEAHEAARAAIEANVDNTLKQEGMGEKSETYTQREILPLSSLVTSRFQNPAEFENLAKSMTEGKAANDAVLEQLRNRLRSDAAMPSVVKLFKATGMIVVAQPLGSDDVSTASPAHPGADSNCSPCVFYRAPRPYLLSVWVARSTEDGKLSLVQTDSKIVDAISDKSDVYAIPLRQSYWTKRDSTLAFSSRGRLIGLSRDYGSAAEDASNAIAAGLTGGLDEYKTALGTIKDIRTTENGLELLPLQQQLAVEQAQSQLNLQPIQDKVALAQQQLSLLQSSTTLEAATKGQQAALQTQLANIQNALLAAQKQLVTSQTALQGAQSDASNAKAQAGLAANSSLLAAQIVEMQNELKLLQLKQQLEDLKKAK